MITSDACVHPFENTRVIDHEARYKFAKEHSSLLYKTEGARTAYRGVFFPSSNVRQIPFSPVYG